MTTLKIGIASVADYKARTLAIARGELKPPAHGPSDGRLVCAAGDGPGQA